MRQKSRAIEQPSRFTRLVLFGTLLIGSSVHWSYSSTEHSESKPQVVEEGDPEAEEAVKPKAHAVHWGYSGKLAAKNWGSLSPDFMTCEKGKSQTPIDLKSMVPGEPRPIRFLYYPSEVEIENNGHTIQFNLKGKNSIRLADQKYDLLQFHFHTPSEHSLLGKLSDLELHMVHKNQSGALAVVSILIQKGAPQEWLSKLWELIPARKNEKVKYKDLFNPYMLLPENKSYYTYLGSLTTPPCSEGVTWIIFKEQMTLSEHQIAQFKALYPINARPIQKLNGRKITYHGE